jgi:hypothetical protein
MRQEPASTIRSSITVYETGVTIKFIRPHSSDFGSHGLDACVGSRRTPAQSGRGAPKPILHSPWDIPGGHPRSIRFSRQAQIILRRRSSNGSSRAFSPNLRSRKWSERSRSRGSRPRHHVGVDGVAVGLVWAAIGRERRCQGLAAVAAICSASSLAVCRVSWVLIVGSVVSDPILSAITEMPPIKTNQDKL